MLTIEFEGWFQCRLPGDPDPADEPRGLSGATFATVGEPDLDRIIRFHDPVAPRSHGPTVGVFVSRVLRGNSAISDSSLLGQKVRFERNAKFLEENGVIAPVNLAIIEPIDFCIGPPDEPLLRRSCFWDPEDPEKSVYDVDAQQIAPRQTMPDLSSAHIVAAVTGISDPVDFLRTRRNILVEEKENILNDPDSEEKRVSIAALTQRLASLQLVFDGVDNDICKDQWDWRARRNIMLLAVCARYRVSLNEILSPDTSTASLACIREINIENEWTLDFWMGAWDNDALCGYVKGAVYVPCLPAS